MPVNKNELTKEMIAKAMQCESADELIALAKTNGYEMTKEEAEAYLAELDDFELESGMLKNVAGGIPITVFTDNIGRGFHQADYNDFHGQYPNIQLVFRKTCGIFHDRYIILDYDTVNERMYHCGASSKDAGNKVTTITEVADRQVYHQIVDVLLYNPELTL